MKTAFRWMIRTAYFGGCFFLFLGGIAVNGPVGMLMAFVAVVAVFGGVGYLLEKGAF